RRIALAARAGRTEQVTELSHHKAQLDRASDDYRRTLAERVPTGHFDELGRLAETLGRWFEARGWWTLALRNSAHADEARAALARLDRIERALASTETVAQPPSAVATIVGQPPSAVATVADALADLIPRGHLARAGALPSSAVPIFRDDAQAAG